MGKLANKLRNDIAKELGNRLGGKWKWITNVGKVKKEANEYIWKQRGFKGVIMKDAVNINGIPIQNMWAVYVRIK